MKRFVNRSLVGLALLLPALACSENGRSLVLVRVAPGNSTNLYRARVVVAQGATVSSEDRTSKDADGDYDIGVYVSKTVSGAVTIAACGYDAAENLVGAAVTTAKTVSPGTQTGPFVMTLDTVMSSELCATPDGGVMGAGGGGGTALPAGDAGAGGGDAAAGAGVAGGGAAGTGGAGGSGPGAAGSGGMAGGAAGSRGTAGAGGTAGGAAGTGAAAGMSGAAGTGGAGGTGHVPTWGTAQVVSNSSALAEQLPRVAVSSKGKAVAVFERGSGIYANSYDPATNAWGMAPVQIDGRAQRATMPRIAVDKNDTYLVVWQQDPNQSLKGIWWSTSTDGGATWTPPASITTTAAFSPALAMNADGVAIVAWTETTPDYWQLGTSFRSAPTAATPTPAWSIPVTVKANQFETDDRTPSVAVSGKGEAFVVWEQDDMGTADQESIFEMHHTAAGWSTAKLFETFDDGPCFAPSIAANAAGVVIATWLEVGNLETIRARRWAFGGTEFGNPVGAISGAEFEAIDNFQAPALVVDPTGVAVVAFAFEIQSQWMVFAIRTDATAAFLTDVDRIELKDDATEDDPNDASVRATEPALGVDPAGNVTLVWRKRTGKRFDAWALRRPPGSGAAWGAATLLETRDIGGVEWPALGVGSDGTAVAVWDYTVEPDVWAAVLR